MGSGADERFALIVVIRGMWDGSGRDCVLGVVMWREVRGGGEYAGHAWLGGFSLNDGIKVNTNVVITVSFIENVVLGDREIYRDAQILVLRFRSGYGVI